MKKKQVTFKSIVSIHSFRGDFVCHLHLLKFSSPCFPDIGSQSSHGRCHQFRTIRGDSGHEGTLVHLTGHPASLMCHRIVRDNSEHCAYASTLQLEGTLSQWPFIQTERVNDRTTQADHASVQLPSVLSRTLGVGWGGIECLHEHLSGKVPRSQPLRRGQ